MNPILVGVVMGSSSDWDTMQHATQILQDFGIGFEAQVVSAHRMPDDMFAYAEAAANLLTNAALDPFGKIPEFKYCAVAVIAGGRLQPPAEYGKIADRLTPTH